MADIVSVVDDRRLWCLSSSDLVRLLISESRTRPWYESSSWPQWSCFMIAISTPDWTSWGERGGEGHRSRETGVRRVDRGRERRPYRATHSRNRLLVRQPPLVVDRDRRGLPLAHLVRRSLNRAGHRNVRLLGRATAVKALVQGLDLVAVDDDRRSGPKGQLGDRLAAANGHLRHRRPKVGARWRFQPDVILPCKEGEDGRSARTRAARHSRTYEQLRVAEAPIEVA
jgi:hypothetical protein